MTIACVRIPSFAAALVRHHTPALRRQPLVLWTAQRQRLLVYAACADAARAGVRDGALLRQAQLHCPQAAALPATPQRDQQTFAALVQALEMLPPQLHVDTFLPHAAATLDLADIQRRLSTALIRQLHTTLRASVPLPASVGLGPSRVVAQVAARAAGKHGSLVVAPDDVCRFLAHQPLRWLPAAAPLLAPLAQLGITTMGAFAALPPDAVAARFGREGTALLRQCQGTDPELTPATPQAMPAMSVW